MAYSEVCFAGAAQLEEVMCMGIGTAFRFGVAGNRSEQRRETTLIPMSILVPQPFIWNRKIGSAALMEGNESNVSGESQLT